jgi:prepilin-type N-terminal cleavage/methylation domain-containing protein
MEMKHNRSVYGFSLIELLVVVAIMAVILGSSIAGYNQFNETQKLKQAALTLKNNLRYAQEKALSSSKPEGITDCGTFVGYRMTVTGAGALSYSMNAVCNNGSEITGPTGIYNLPQNVSFGNSAQILFQPLTKGVSGATGVVLKLDSASVMVNVAPNGEISY